MCTKFHVCIVFRFTRRRDTIDTNESCVFTKLQVCIVFRLERGSQKNKRKNIEISPTSREPDVDLNLET